MVTIHEPQHWRVCWNVGTNQWRVQHEPAYDEAGTKLTIYLYDKLYMRGVDTKSVERGPSGHFITYGILSENGMDGTIRGEPGRL